MSGWGSELVIETLRERLETFPHAFRPGDPIHLARAPGRLDVMGGIADYSGSLVLEMPIKETTVVAVQERDDSALILYSEGVNGSRSEVVLDRAMLYRSGALIELDALRDTFKAHPEHHWTSYVLGPLLVLLRERSHELRKGLSFFVHSDIPEGKGVSSSAALEVATMRALASLFAIALDGPELARLCQLAENHVAGAPCGIMDPLTSALGTCDQLLALHCQPATLCGQVRLPDGLQVWGLDSGVRHAVSGADYTDVRIGAFMGYRIIAELAGLSVTHVAEQEVHIDDPEWGGYLANLSPAQFDTQFAPHLPETLTGEAFLAQYYGTTDPVTRIQPKTSYAIKGPTRHPIYENADVHRFRELLQGPITPDACQELGSVMHAAHQRYTACQLGSVETDQLVGWVYEYGLGQGLIGAKITGGGSGGTVAVLGRSDARPILDEIADRFADATSHHPYLFDGSSSGAYETPVWVTAL